MSRETPVVLPSSGDPHRECWDLLPWLVTGRLGAAEREQVEAHLGSCESCRDELAAQRELRERMSADDGVSYSPAASFEKLWSRIEETDREAPDAAPDVKPNALPAHRHEQRKTFRPSRLPYWLAAAVIVQAFSLAWLATGLVSSGPQVSVAHDSSDSTWPFQTASSTPPANAAGALLSVVFARDLTMGQLRQTLETHGLVIVRGSAASDVFTLVAPGRSREEALLLVERLRVDPAVRFAQVANPAGSP